MRFPSLLLVLCLAGAVLASVPLHAQQALPPQLEQHIEAAEARVAQPSAQKDGVAWWQLGMLQQDAARYRDAERSYLHAISLLDSGDPATLADALDSAGTMYVETGDYARGAAFEQRALALRHAQNDSLGEGRCWMHLAMLSLGRHDAAAALRYAQLAKQRLVDAKSQTSLAASPEEKMTALVDLSLALCAEGRCARALAPLEQAHRIAVDDASVSGDFPAGYVDFLLGYVHWQVGDTAQAAGLMKRGTAAMESQLGFGHPTYFAALTQYRAFLEQTGDLAGAAAVRARLARLQSPVQTASAFPAVSSR
jgi:tetratricopeptide (TPR) repeat protein